MAKRARASRSTHRPGGQGPSRSRKSDDASTSPAEPAIEAETVSAGEMTVEASDPHRAETAVAPPAAQLESRRTRRARRAKTRPDNLAAQAEAENAWVRADLRRIAIVSAIMLVALAVAWVLFVALDVLSLY